MVVAVQVAEGRLASLAHQMSKWVDQAIGPGYHSYSEFEAFCPHVNFYEDETKYCLVVELPGVSTDDLLRAEDGMLIISGDRQTLGLEQMSESVHLHHMEIDHGCFYRGIKLPEDADVETIQATYRNGFLWVKILKRS